MFRTVQLPADMADPAQARDDLEDALDDMCDDSNLFLGKYEVRSSLATARPGGGQGLVQFARDGSHDCDVAIKVLRSARCQTHSGSVFEEVMVWLLTCFCAVAPATRLLLLDARSALSGRRLVCTCRCATV